MPRMRTSNRPPNGGNGTHHGAPPGNTGTDFDAGEAGDAGAGAAAVPDDIGNRADPEAGARPALPDDIGNRAVPDDRGAREAGRRGAPSGGARPAVGAQGAAAGDGARAEPEAGPAGSETAGDAGGALGLAAHPLADQFGRLDPESVLEAVERGGRRCTGRFLVLNSFENRVYQFELEGGEWVVGKFYRPGRWSRETIAEEHAFVLELADEEVPVVCPLPLADGSFVGEVHGILYSLYPRVGGRAPEELDREAIAVLGRLLARMHLVGARRDAPHRLRLTPETYGRQNLAFLLEGDFIHPEARDVYAASVEALLARIEPLFAGVETHRIHGDCHLGNLLWRPEGPTFLDFDDMVVGPPVQDVWLLVPSADAQGQAERECLLEAYDQIRPADPAWLRLVEPLRALRYIHYAAWIARRWYDPYFRKTFSHFGTLVYWQREVQDLREQIARIDALL